MRGSAFGNVIQGDGSGTRVRTPEVLRRSQTSGAIVLPNVFKCPMMGQTQMTL